jgi:hypothetical protein
VIRRAVDPDAGRPPVAAGRRIPYESRIVLYQSRYVVPCGYE